MRRATLLAAIALSATAPAAAGASTPASRIFVLAADEGFMDVAATPDGGLVAARSGGIVRLPSRGAPALVARYERAGAEGGLGVAAAPDGSLLVADGAHSRIERILPDGGRQVVAGTGEPGFSGDGGLASAATLHPGYGGGLGIAVAPTGEVLFTDTQNHRVRRIRRDGIIDTVAGSGAPRLALPPAPAWPPVLPADGSPAVSAPLYHPEDVLPLADGGFLASDGLSHVWRVRPDGSLVRFAGSLDPMRSAGEGDGGLARDASIGLGRLALTAAGDVLIAGAGRVRAVDGDGTIRTLADLGRGDFAGRTRTGDPGAVAVTAEGGVAIAAGALYYLAPRDTERTLVALRDARVSRHHVAVAIDATQDGTARLEVRRRGRLVATSSRRIRAGRGTLRVRGPFGPRLHGVRVRVAGPHGTTARDAVSLFTSRRLPHPLGDGQIAARMRDVAEAVGEGTSEIDRCRRLTPRRVDCAVVDPAVGGCATVLAFALRPSGVVFHRGYRCVGPRPFHLRPIWIGRPEPLT